MNSSCIPTSFRHSSSPTCGLYNVSINYVFWWIFLLDKLIFVKKHIPWSVPGFVLCNVLPLPWHEVLPFPCYFLGFVTISSHLDLKSICSEFDAHSEEESTHTLCTTDRTPFIFFCIYMASCFCVCEMRLDFVPLYHLFIPIMHCLNYETLQKY